MLKQTLHPGLPEMPPALQAVGLRSYAGLTMGVFLIEIELFGPGRNCSPKFVIPGAQVSLTFGGGDVAVMFGIKAGVPVDEESLAHIPYLESRNPGDCPCGLCVIRALAIKEQGKFAASLDIEDESGQVFQNFIMEDGIKVTFLPGGSGPFYSS